MKKYNLSIKSMENILKEKSEHWFIQKERFPKELAALDIGLNEF